jgi:hypothetical protein
MRFLWFGKKKAPRKAPVETIREPQEVFSVTDFISINNPITGSSKTGLTDDVINSAIFSLLSQDHSSANLAAQTFFQSRGAILLPTSDYSYNPARGYGARIQDGDLQRTILIGAPVVIMKATTPFCEAISQAVTQNSDCFVVALDGIAYASYRISSEWV